MREMVNESRIHVSEYYGAHRSCNVLVTIPSVILQQAKSNVDKHVSE